MSNISTASLTSFTTVSQQAFVFDDANRFRGPGSVPLISTLIDTVSLNSSIPGITGKHFRSSNSCKAFICKDGSGVCNHIDSICKDKLGVEGKDYFLAYSYFSILGAFIDVDKNWTSLGYDNGSIQMLWKGAPAFGSRLNQPQSKIWASDVDFTSYTTKEDNDAFAELQAYHSLTLQHRFFYEKLNVSQLFSAANEPIGDFCLLGSGPICKEADPYTKRKPYPLEYPLTFVVNFPSIQFDPSSKSAYQPPLDQIAAGKGKTLQDPVTFDEWDDFGEAFFSPPSLLQNPQNCNGSCNSIPDMLALSLTLFAFGQSTAGGDWALNDCIVYHEYTHAVVSKLVPTLETFTWTKTGLSSEPGAMNEGWADYFAAIHCHAQDFRTDTYNGKPGRSILNTRTCRDMLGEVHSDGTVFAGGLWDVRRKIIASFNDPTTFDHTVLKGISLSVKNETFGVQYTRILDLMRQTPSLSSFAEYAKLVFETRVLNCTMIGDYGTSSTPTFYLPSSQITSSNVSTLPGQLRLKFRGSDWGVAIKWRQIFYGPFGESEIGYARSLMGVWVSRCPLSLNGGVLDVPVNATGCDLKEEKMGVGEYYHYFGIGSSGDLYVKVWHTLPVGMAMVSTYFVYWGFVTLVCVIGSFILQSRYALATFAALDIMILFGMLVTLVVKSYRGEHGGKVEDIWYTRPFLALRRSTRLDLSEIALRVAGFLMSTGIFVSLIIGFKLSWWMDLCAEIGFGISIGHGLVCILRYLVSSKEEGGGLMSAAYLYSNIGWVLASMTGLLSGYYYLPAAVDILMFLSLVAFGIARIWLEVRYIV